MVLRRVIVKHAAIACMRNEFPSSNFPVFLLGNLRVFFGVCVYTSMDSLKLKDLNLIIDLNAVIVKINDVNANEIYYFDGS